MECAKCKTTGTELKRCTGCYSIYYCSRSCQTRDWSKHRDECASITYKKINSREYKDKTEEESHAADNFKDDVIADCMKAEYSHDSLRKDAIEVEGCSEDTPKYSDKVFGSSKEEQINKTHKIKSSGSYKQHWKEADRDKNTLRDKNVMKVGNGTSGRRDEDGRTREIERPEDAKAKGERKQSCDTDGVKYNCCEKCGLGGCSKKCSRCKTSFYCSAICQQQDWKQHKLTCTKVYTDEELAILQTIREQAAKNESHLKFIRDGEAAGKFVSSIWNYGGEHNRFFQMLTEEQALILAKRPDGSLQKAVKLAKSFYPREKIITYFSDVPREPVFPMFAGLLPRPSGYVLVAFMYRYHEHVMRHGVYLKDAINSDSKVEFYLDDRADDPFPFFSYSQVKPGGYICLQDPMIHIFGDSSVGVRIDDPSQVRVFDIEKVMAVSV